MKKFPEKQQKSLFVVWAQAKHGYFGKGIKIIKINIPVPL